MEAVVEQDVVGLDIPVYDLGRDGVEIAERISSLDRDAHPRGPREPCLACTGTVEVVCNSAVGHVLVHEEELSAATGGAAVQGNEVWVSEGGEYADLRHELLHSPAVVLVQSLDGHRATITKISCTVEASTNEQTELWMGGKSEDTLIR